MKSTSVCLAASLAAAALVPFAAAEAQGVMVARKAAQRIHHMIENQQGSNPGYEFAAVILEAPADKVYGTALQRARNNTAVRIVVADQASRRLQLTDGERLASINVVALSDEISQLYVSALLVPGQGSTVSRVVQAIMRVCADMNKTCELAR